MRAPWHCMTLTWTTVVSWVYLSQITVSDLLIQFVLSFMIYTPSSLTCKWFIEMLHIKKGMPERLGQSYSRMHFPTQSQWYFWFHMFTHNLLLSQQKVEPRSPPFETWKTLWSLELSIWLGHKEVTFTLQFFSLGLLILGSQHIMMKRYKSWEKAHIERF